MIIAAINENKAYWTVLVAFEVLAEAVCRELQQQALTAQLAPPEPGWQPHWVGLTEPSLTVVPTPPQAMQSAVVPPGL
jgi:hypothetical protein